jgi:hypothetical protein
MMKKLSLSRLSRDVCDHMTHSCSSDRDCDCEPSRTAQVTFLSLLNILYHAKVSTKI